MLNDSAENESVRSDALVQTSWTSAGDRSCPQAAALRGNHGLPVRSSMRLISHRLGCYELMPWRQKQVNPSEHEGL